MGGKKGTLPGFQVVENCPYQSFEMKLFPTEIVR